MALRTLDASSVTSCGRSKCKDDDDVFSSRVVAVVAVVAAAVVAAVALRMASTTAVTAADCRSISARTLARSRGGYRLAPRSVTPFPAWVARSCRAEIHDSRCCRAVLVSSSSSLLLLMPLQLSPPTASMADSAALRQPLEHLMTATLAIATGSSAALY